MNRAWASWLCAVAALTSGCGKSTGAGGSSSSASTGTATAAEACTALEHAICDARDACSQNGYLNDRNYGSEAICETRTPGPCEKMLIAKGTTQTPTGIEACAQAYATDPCLSFFDTDQPMQCQPATPGTVAQGGACGANNQCATGFCATGTYAVCGTCQPKPAVGAACQSQADCGGGLACGKPAGATALTIGACAAFVAQSGACDDDAFPCQAGQQCVGAKANVAQSGTCQPAVSSVGGTCDSSRKTAPACDADDGLACNHPTGMAMGTCAPIQLVGAGKPCGTVGTATVECQAGGLCKKAATTDAMGTCVAPAADGTPCDADPLKGPPCLAPAKCVSSGGGSTAGTCTVADATKCM